MNENWLKEFESLTITDDVIFGATFEEYPELCKHLIEIILDIKVKDLHYIEREKSIDERLDAKGIRLDIYVEEQGTGRSFDIEMQIANKADLGKRMRYYQGMIDMDKLKPGDSYKQLTDSYIIFICLFDPFKRRLGKYTFRTACLEDRSLDLNDGLTKVVLNAKGLRKDMSVELKNFLDYVQGKKVSGDRFIDALDAAVESIKRQERVRMKHMKLQMLLQEKAEEIREEEREKGREEGRAEGIAEGRAEGESKLARLMQKLFAEGKVEDAKEAAENKARRAELFKQYGIV